MIINIRLWVRSDTIIKYLTIDELFKENNSDNRACELSGNGWVIEKIDDDYILSFISGDILGVEKKTKIMNVDFDLLKNRMVDINDILIKYHLG
ncbi:hypothetical protein [Testudinibacter sp. TR-2022]|uniref:hypothetical protein n=1 Tax=Testudinibacter sp. TR-2022 TaxID=2585029 RepID=UPI00111ABC52|nr:hypothetical protein [Testudinibacter sp. TR-2022]TNH02321.1 hypothetical protein FHQ30_13155 [Pasteurellaceae bacterium Phil11]TNH20921.1 hypothetical protein FHQ29_11380 [Testudinibacter sp. TR-2022]TNH23683.1 hypothetical protein FHQ27_11125 [Testudinibacter sp. TR-2022]